MVEDDPPPLELLGVSDGGWPCPGAGALCPEGLRALWGLWGSDMLAII